MVFTALHHWRFASSYNVLILLSALKWCGFSTDDKAVGLICGFLLLRHKEKKAVVAQEYLWLDWFLLQWRKMVPGFFFAFLLFWLKYYACYAWRMNNLFKEYVNRPTHTHEETHTHTGSLFRVGPCCGKMIYSLLVLLPILLTDWMTEPSVCMCVCKWTEQSWHLY